MAHRPSGGMRNLGNSAKAEGNQKSAETCHLRGEVAWSSGLADVCLKVAFCEVLYVTLKRPFPHSARHMRHAVCSTMKE